MCTQALFTVCLLPAHLPCCLCKTANMRMGLVLVVVHSNERRRTLNEEIKKKGIHLHTLIRSPLCPPTDAAPVLKIFSYYQGLIQLFSIHSVNIIKLFQPSIECMKNEDKLCIE